MARVLLLSPSAVPGGAERALVGLARHLPSLGWEPVAVLLEDGKLTGWLHDVDCSTTVIGSGRVRDIHRFIRTCDRIRNFARREGCTAIISNQSKGHLYGGIAGVMGSTPSYFWQHGNPGESVIDRLASRIPAKGIVAGSKAAVRAQCRFAHGSRVALIYPGVEVEEIAKRRGEGNSLRAHLGLKDTRTVGIVGRLQPWKGQMLFLRAASRIASAYRDVQFIIVGGAILGWEGNYPNELKTFVDNTPVLRGRVTFAGHQEDVYPWFDLLDIVVHASMDEPVGLVLMEAMALGRPLVASNSGGPTEIVENGISGVLFRSGDEANLSEVIQRLLGDDSVTSRLSAGAQERAKLFTARQMARRWSSILNDSVDDV